MNIFIYLLLIIVASLGLVRLLALTSRHKLELFEQLTKEVGGQSYIPWYSQVPALEFYHQGFRCTVTGIPGGSDGRSTTFFKFKFPSNMDRPTLVIHPEGSLSQIKKFSGLKEVQVADEQFDGSFYVRAADQGFANRLLGTEVRSLFNDCKTAYPWLVLSSTGSYFKVDRLFHEEKGYLRFIEQGKTVIDLIVEALKDER